MSRGKLITIEGSEGAGKSTAVKYIQAYFAQHHLPFVLTREPGGTELAEEIRQVLLHPESSEKMAGETELLLMFASRAQHITALVKPAIEAGQYVISDRYVDASYAYQGGGRQLNMQQIKVLDELIVGALQPDMTLLFDIPVDLGLARTRNRASGKDRIEHEKIEFFERVRHVYLERAKQDPARIKIIDASQSIENVQMQIRTELDKFFASNN